MSNFVKQINGVFTVDVDGKEYPNLVVATGLSNIFGDNQIASLCDTLKVFNDEEEVILTDTDYLSPVASSSNVTDVVFGVSGDGASDYFFMKKTWTFFQGQIKGVINKVAVYSDDGTLYAAALLKNAEGEIEPVRPLFAPKVEITYESRWHFKQGDNFNLGTPVYFSEAGMVTVKTNMADKNNPVTYENMDKPFEITKVEMFSDTITTDESLPTESIGVIDPSDYNIKYINGEFDAYGQYLNLLLPKDKYINDTPIATMLITTTRGLWQIGFDEPLEKPTLSKREISLTIPFVHGIVKPDGEFEVTGNPDAINSIFSSLTHSTYNISTRAIKYDDAGEITVTKTVITVPADPDNEPPIEEVSELVEEQVTAYYGDIKDMSTELMVVMPVSDVLVIAAGTSPNLAEYLGDVQSGVLLELKVDTLLKGTVDGVDIEVDIEEFTPAVNDAVYVSVGSGFITLTIPRSGNTYTTPVTTAFTDNPDHLIVGVKGVTQDKELTIY